MRWDFDQFLQIFLQIPPLVEGVRERTFLSYRMAWFDLPLNFIFCDLDRKNHRLLFSWLRFYSMFTSKFNRCKKCKFLTKGSDYVKNKKRENRSSIEVYTEDFKNDYISLTDITRYKNKIEPNVVVANWMRNHNTIEYLGIWEQLNNPAFNPIEFEGFLKEAGSNAFTLSPQR